jgi:MoxR-like ATPase
MRHRREANQLMLAFPGTSGLCCPDTLQESALLDSPSSATERTIDSSALDGVRKHLGTRVVGQRELIDSMLICLVSEGHVLVEGMPGLAKTTAVKALAEAIEGDYHRVQFTPDLLPSDLIGTDIYRHEKGEFEFRAGPLFHNILLADEVNRAPAKVQSALLEAMGEGQVTVGLKTYAMPELFMVLATQNPIEQEGTYNLPEAQLDRFLMHVNVDYPDHQDELAILELDSNRQLTAPAAPAEVLSQKKLFKVREDAARLYLDAKLNRYIVDLVQASRKPGAFDEGLKRWCRFGASPRATIALARCARTRAWLDGDEFVAPQHIQAVAPDVLRHRILLTFEAESEGVTSDEYVRRLMEVVAIP